MVVKPNILGYQSFPKCGVLLLNSVEATNQL